MIILRKSTEKIRKSTEKVNRSDLTFSCGKLHAIMADSGLVLTEPIDYRNNETLTLHYRFFEHKDKYSIIDIYNSLIIGIIGKSCFSHTHFNVTFIKTIQAI